MSLKKEVQWNVIAWVISSTISRPGEGSAGSGGAAMWEAETRTISLISVHAMWGMKMDAKKAGQLRLSIKIGLF